MALGSLFLLSLVLHGLVAWRLVPDLILMAAAAWLGAAWLALSAALMPLGLVAPRLVRARLATALTWAGLLCMGLFSSLLVLTLLRELLMLLVLALQWTGAATVDMQPLRALSAAWVGPLALAMTLWGFWNARRTATVLRVDIPIANLPEALVGFSIAQISDIHVGPTIQKAYLQRIVNRVNSLQADMVAITGDLVDGPVHTLGPLVEPLRELRARHGSFFVTGNHEYYSGAQGWIDHLRSMGLTVLLNEHVLIEHRSTHTERANAHILLAGVTDYSAQHFDTRHTSDPLRALGHPPPHTDFKLLLAHQPRSAFAAADAGFDLQLSGHTHGGQFWPWGYFVRFQQPFTAGLHRLKNMWIYTSRGTGYWGPPKRFGAPSEITYIRLVRP